MLANQLDVLNDGYSPHQISFNLLNTTRTINPIWATNGSDTADIDMKRALRKGDYKALNVYFVYDLGDVLGVSFQNL
jgi:hypothetical protein